MDVRSTVFENAARLRALHGEVKRAYREAPHGPAHTAACAAFHASYDALAFPGGLDRAMRRLKRLEPEAVEAAIQFLEAGPWFFRSGYITEEIVRRLKQAPLTERQRNRLASVIVRSLSTGTRRLARHLARLVKVAQPTTLRRQLEACAAGAGEAQLRARYALHVLRSLDNSRVP